MVTDHEFYCKIHFTKYKNLLKNIDKFSKIYYSENIKILLFLEVLYGRY